MARLMRAYNKAMTTHPWKTQIISTGALMGTGDFASQLFVEKKPLKEVDMIRTVRFAGIGCFFVAPVIRTWFGILHKTFGSTGKAAALKKMAADQLLMAPCFLASILGLVEFTRNGMDVQKTKKFVAETWFDVLKVNYVIWPFVQTANFYFMPLDYQLVFVQCVNLFWNTFLAWRANVDHKQQAMD